MEFKLGISRDGIFFMHEYPKRGFYKQNGLYYIGYLNVGYSDKESITSHHKGFNVIGITDFDNTRDYLVGKDEIQIYDDISLLYPGTIGSEKMKTIKV